MVIFQHNIKDKKRGSHCQHRGCDANAVEYSVGRRRASDNSDGMEQVLTTQRV